MKESQYLDNILEHIKNEVPLADVDLEKIQSGLELIELKKKEYLIEPGMISNHMNFISKGCLRSFYMDEDAHEHTLQLGIEQWWINDLYSYLTLKPSVMYVQALEPTVIVRLPRKHLDHLYEEVHEISNFFRLKFQSAYINIQERMIKKMSEDAFERYSRFRKNYRDIEQRVPQYIIASYLGVTPEFLSTLRKQHAKDLS